MKYILLTIVLLSVFGAAYLKLYSPEFFAGNSSREFLFNLWLFAFGAVAVGGGAYRYWFARR